VHDKMFGTCELMRRVVAYQSADINPSDLASLAVKMKNPRTGLKFTSSGIRSNVFLGSEALAWLGKNSELTDADCVDICTQLLKEKLIVPNKTLEDATTFKKTRKYFFDVRAEFNLCSDLNA